MLLTVAALTAGAACGDDSNNGADVSATTRANPVPSDTASPSDAGADVAGDGDIVEQIGGAGASDAISALGIGAKASALASALGSDRDPEIVNDNTARLFLDGDVEADSLTACIVVGAIIDADETVIVAYPNGEITCG